MRELTSVTEGVGGAGCKEWLSDFREFVSCRELKEELHRSELYEEFYAGLTNAQSIDEPLDDIDDEMRLTNLETTEITAAVHKWALQSREAIVRLVRAHIATRAIGAKRGSTRRGIGQPR